MAKTITGTNIGGWLVLEPWITPSLFYRFLGKTQNETGIDSYTFCESLGPVEGNKVMRNHWKHWYTEEHIANLSMRGVDMVRLPIGDWTLNQYGPYFGCMDGADEQIDWMLDMCAKYNITVLMDVHTAKGSQNGFDNSGQAFTITWEDASHYRHDDNPQWIGNFTNGDNGALNFDNLGFSLETMEKLLIRYGNHSAFAAFEPVNEPWWNTPLEPLKDFYRSVRKLVRRYAPQATFVFHDSFRYDPIIWNDLFRKDDVEKTAIDHHYYWAFGNNLWKLGDLCTGVEKEAEKASQFNMDVWFGEWALASENCALHLNGFNDGTINDHDGLWKCAQMECP